MLRQFITAILRGLTKRLTGKQVSNCQSQLNFLFIKRNNFTLFERIGKYTKRQIELYQMTYWTSHHDKVPCLKSVFAMSKIHDLGLELFLHLPDLIPSDKKIRW